MTEIAISGVDELINSYVKSVLEKSKEGKKLTERDYMILVIYYVDRKIGDTLGFMDKRFDDLRKDIHMLVETLRKK